MAYRNVHQTGAVTQTPGRPTYQNVHQTGAVTQTPGRPPPSRGGGGGPSRVLNPPPVIPKGRTHPGRTHPGRTHPGGITGSNRFKKWLASKNPFKKPMSEYFYPSKHGDMYIGLQTGEIPTSNYHKDVTADYWKNVSKNWGEVHPALGAMVNVGAPAGTMIGGLMYDVGQAAFGKYPENPNKYLSSLQQEWKTAQENIDPSVKAALESRGVTGDYFGVDLMGTGQAIAAEQPIKSNLQRMAGSVEPFLNAWGIGNNLNYARGGIVDLYRYGGF
tara:strand:+ start:51 stop:869 length:819 start_codon:yes stop_codon:yes gene_type:complete